MEEIKDIISQAKRIRNDIEEYKQYDFKKAYYDNYKSRKTSVKSTSINRIYKFYYRVAAVLLLPLLGLSMTLSYISYKNYIDSSNISWIEVSSAPGLVSKIQLPDSSLVWLNSGSKIKYPSQFKGDKRNVKLYGEGLFDVQSDKKHPFYVELSNGVKVMAHGTKFNITSYNNDSLIETTLLRGKVDLLTCNNSIPMKPSQKTIFNKNTSEIVLKNVDTEEAVDWKDGKIIFRNATIDEALRKISRRYNVNIHFQNKTGRNYRIRANFTYENVSQILGYLQMIVPLEWNLEQNKREKNLIEKTYSYNVWIN